MNRILIVLFLVVGLNWKTQAQESVYFFIICKSNNDSIAQFAGEYEKIMASYLEKAFPCVRAKTQHDIYDKIEVERQRQLTGGTTDWPSFCNDLKADFLVNLEASDFLSSQLIVSASIIDYKKKESVARESKYGSNTVASLKKLFNEVSESVTEKLSDYEVCPYTGHVNIKIESEKDETKNDGYPQYCGGNATITTEIKSKSTLEWKLNKVKKIRTSGTAQYDLNEKYKIDSYFTCYKCKNGMEGGTHITETRETEAKTQGLSKESTFEGEKIEDARIQIHFLSDDTYTILVTGTTEKGSMKVTTEKKFEGPCEDESEPKDTKNKQVDVPLSIILGPYKGTGKDKTLSKNETKDLTIGQEKITLTIDFSLTRQ